MTSLWNANAHPRLPLGRHGGEFTTRGGGSQTGPLSVLGKQIAAESATRAQMEDSLRRYLDGHPPRRGDAVGVRRSKGRVVVMRIAAATAIAAAATGFIGSGVEHANFRPPGNGPSVSQVESATGRAHHGLNVRLPPEVGNSLTFTASRPRLLRLTADWSAMSPTDRAAFVSQVVAALDAPTELSKGAGVDTPLVALLRRGAARGVAPAATVAALRARAAVDPLAAGLVDAWEQLRADVHALNLSVRSRMIAAAIDAGVDPDTAVELAATPDHRHIPGTQYNWRHEWHPLNVQTALLNHKKAAAKELFKAGAPHAAPESKAFYQSHPSYPKTIKIGRNGGLTSVQHLDQLPNKRKAPLPAGATAIGKKAYNAPEVLAGGRKTLQAAALQKAVQTGTTQWVSKAPDGKLVISEHKPSAVGKHIEFTPTGQAIAHTASGSKVKLTQAHLNDKLGPLFTPGGGPHAKPKLPAEPDTLPAETKGAAKAAAVLGPRLGPALPPGTFRKSSTGTKLGPIQGPAKPPKTSSGLGPVQGPAAPPTPFEPKTDRFTPINTDGWSKVGGQQGSNPGGTYANPHGAQFYIKQSKTPGHARNEALASAFYQAAGVDHAEVQLANHNGHLATASPIIVGAKKDLASKIASDPAYKAKVQDGFAVDAWLANWDVVGANHDNIVSDAFGNPVRVDPGGALLYRAQGSAKGPEFGNTVGEWTSLRDGSKNPQSQSVFGGMTDAQLRASAQKVVAISPAKIDKLVDASGFDKPTAEKLKATLKARRADIAAKAGLTLPEAKTAGPSLQHLHDSLPTASQSAKLTSAPTTSARPTYPSPVAAAGPAKALAAQTGQPAYIKTLGPKKFGVTSTKPADKHVLVKPDGSVAVVTGNAGNAPTTRPATAVPAPKLAENHMGKLSKKGALVVSAPVGTHPVGSTISVTHPTTGAINSHEVTGVGKAFPVKGVDHQYHYLSEPKNVPVPAPAAPTAGSATRLVQRHVGAPTQGSVKALSETGQFGSQAYLVPGNTLTGFKITTTKPDPGTPHYAAGTDGVVTSVASNGTSKVIYDPAPSPDTFHQGLGEANTAAAAKAAITGKPAYVVIAHTGPNAGQWKVTSTNPGSNVGPADTYKQFLPDGSPATYHTATTPATGKATDATPETLPKAPAPAAGTFGDSQHATLFAGLAAAKAHAKGSGSNAYLSGSIGKGFTVSSTKPASGYYNEVTPTGGVTSPTDVAPPQAYSLPQKATVENLQKTGVSGHVYADGSWAATPIPGKGAEQHVQVLPNGEVISSTAAAGAPSARGGSLGPEQLTPGQLAAVVAAKNSAANSGKSWYLNDAGTLLPTKTNPVTGSTATVEVHPDGTLTALGTGPKLGPAAPAPTVAAPKVKLKNPQVKAAKGLGPTNKALLNAPPVDPSAYPVGSTKHYNAIHAQGMQTAIQTGQTHYVLGNGYLIQAGTLTTVKPAEGTKFTSYSPDGTITSYYSSGYGYPQKPSQSKAAALGALKAMGAAPAPGASGSGVSKAAATVSNTLAPELKYIAPVPIPGKGLGTGNGLASVHETVRPFYEGTPEAEWINAAKPGLPGEIPVAQNFEANAHLSSTQVSALNSYTGNWATDINEKLRTGAALSDTDRSRIAQLDAAMNKWVLPDPVVINRGLGATYYPKENLVGQVVQDAGFMSASFKAGFPKAVRLHLVAPAGTHAVSVYGAGGGNMGKGHPEAEFLLPRGTQYVVSKDVTINGVRHITGTIVPTAPSSPVVTGVVKAPTETGKVTAAAYTKTGLLFLQNHGQTAWLRKYGTGGGGVGGGIASPAPVLTSVT